MALLLEQFYQGKILAKNTTYLLLKMMTESTTGANRIKGLLPAGTVVAHKTGSSATDAQGLTPATNDAGIITLPNGKHLVVAVLFAVLRITNKPAKVSSPELRKRLTIRLLPVKLCFLLK